MTKQIADDGGKCLLRCRIDGTTDSVMVAYTQRFKYAPGHQFEP